MVSPQLLKSSSSKCLYVHLLACLLSAMSLQHGFIAHLLTMMVCQAVEATAGPHSAEQASCELPGAS